MEDEYESLPAGNPCHHHMIAGSCAGILEHAFVYPIDSVKTRLMCLQPVEEARYTGLIDGLKKITMKEGFMKSMRGISAVVVGAGPAHALYFAVYEKVKNTLTYDRYPLLNNAAYCLAGASATLVHDAIMTPVDAIKQRMQVYKSPYTNSWTCFRQVVNKYGFQILYRAYITQLTMTIPHHMAHVTVYELSHDIANPDRHYRPLVHVTAGALGGAVAAFITTPLDVCKTVINTQNTSIINELPKGSNQINGLISSAKAIHYLGGYKAFFRGAVARVVFTMPGTAISWSVYEFFKHTLSKGNFSFSSSPYSAPDIGCDSFLHDRQKI
uniref:Slc25a-8 n=1 Tax=Schmidtea mediterranea TaxID=79327 RepID=A0A0H3YJ63_SCHMD|nr:slc25a-8 [Schmidtea mediterranea]